jgi:hypothetical protein
MIWCTISKTSNKEFQRPYNALKEALNMEARDWCGVVDTSIVQEFSRLKIALMEEDHDAFTVKDHGSLWRIELKI